MKNTYYLLHLLLAAILIIATPVLKAQTFSNPVPIPYIMPGPHFDIDIFGAQHNFDPNGSVTDINLNVPLATYCYNEIGNTGMSYLGPTLIFEKGENLTFNITNFLPDNANTTVHWHGLNLPAEMDGGPHQVIFNGTTWSPFFPSIDDVQTAWYHTHLMDLTTDQVIRGLAGMIIVDDPENDPLYDVFPNEYGINDFPIVIQEKGFVLDSTTTPPTAMAIKAGEKPGNGPYTLINGVVGGVMHVPQQGFVRLRILNGSPRKMFNIGLSRQLHNPTTFETMWFFASGGGYLDYLRSMDSTLMSVGDRREFLVSFENHSNGDTIYMSNLSLPQDVRYGNTPGSALMAFVVDNTIVPQNPVFSVPFQLGTLEPVPGEIHRTREKNLMGQPNPPGQGQQWTIDGTPMDLNVINDTVLVNTKERWVIHNLTEHAHPFHIHKVQFQVVEYEGLLGASDESGTYTFPDLPDELVGYKDVQLIRKNATLTFEARFDSFPSPLDANYGFMYHCHILTHEDTSMMHQFVVVDSVDYFTGNSEVQTALPLEVFPNPAGKNISFKGDYNDPGILRFYDLSGKLLREEEVFSLSESTVPVGDLPRGMVIVEFTSGQQVYVRKLTLH